MDTWWIVGGAAAYAFMGSVMIGVVIGAQAESSKEPDVIALILIALLWPFVLAVVIGTAIIGWFKGRTLARALLIQQALERKREGQE